MKYTSWARAPSSRPQREGAASLWPGPGAPPLRDASWSEPQGEARELPGLAGTQSLNAARSGRGAGGRAGAVRPSGSAPTARPGTQRPDRPLRPPASGDDPAAARPGPLKGDPTRFAAGAVGRREWKGRRSLARVREKCEPTAEAGPLPGRVSLRRRSDGPPPGPGAQHGRGGGQADAAALVAAGAGRRTSGTTPRAAPLGLRGRAGPRASNPARRRALPRPPREGPERTSPHLGPRRRARRHRLTAGGTPPEPAKSGQAAACAFLPAAVRAAGPPGEEGERVSPRTETVWSPRTLARQSLHGQPSVRREQPGRTFV